MKTSIYNRIPTIATAELIDLRAVWLRLCADRAIPPRHDYWGKCIARASLILEARQAPPHSKTIRK